MEHTITLQYAQLSVTFGKRLTGGDLMDIDSDPQSQSRTQYVDLIRRRAMTKFGDTKVMPPPLSMLLALNKIDRDDIAEGFEEFQRLSREDRTTEFLPDNTTRLYFGFNVGEIVYPIVEMNRLPTGMDEVEADALGLEGLIREVFLIGKRITKLSTADGQSIDGPISLEMFRELDGDDLYVLRKGATLAEVFFRIKGREVSQKRDSTESSTPVAGNADDGAGDSEPAEAADRELPVGD